MHVVTQLFDRGSTVRLARSLRTSGSEAEQLATVGGVLDEQLSTLTSADERRVLYLGIASRLRGADPPPQRVMAEDVYGGLAILWLMVLATVPAIVRFIWFTDRFAAARVSNGLMLLTLFAVGYGVVRSIHGNPWRLGLLTAVFGLAMVVIVVLLGG
jgi:VIT1/CCC1 family predicted Fe2+/Mn2+ transporter